MNTNDKKMIDDFKEFMEPGVSEGTKKIRESLDKDKLCEIEFKDNNWFSEISDIILRKGNKSVKLFYGNNGDLYLDIFGEHNRGENGLYTASFSICEEDDVYSYFSTLIDDILNCNVLDVSDIELSLCETDEQKKKLIESSNKCNQLLMSSDEYNELVRDEKIIWYSDNIYNERANIVEIQRNVNKIVMNFFDNPSDPAFGFSIRICNSGSKYDPFNTCFMKMFNQLQELKKNKQMNLKQKNSEKNNE